MGSGSVPMQRSGYGAEPHRGENPGILSALGDGLPPNLVGTRPPIRSLYHTRHCLFQQQSCSAPAVAHRFGVQHPALNVPESDRYDLGPIHSKQPILECGCGWPRSYEDKEIKISEFLAWDNEGFRLSGNEG